MLLVALLDRIIPTKLIARPRAFSSSLPQLGGTRRSARVALLTAATRLGMFAAPLLVGASLGTRDGADGWLYGYGAALAAAGAFSGVLEQRAATRAAAAFGYGRRAVRRVVDGWSARALAASLAGAVAGAALLVGIEPAGMPLARVLTIYALFAVVLAAASLGALSAGALVAAGRVEAAVSSQAIRGTTALAGAAVACALGDVWPLAVALAAGELARAMWLRMRLATVLGKTSRRSGAPLETRGRAAGALGAVAVVLATGLLSHVSHPAAALLVAGEILYAVMLSSRDRR
ncbi:MAG: hypothetical protein JWN44_2338 [Myxococcales bacterium]|nr:hypothetical protein [Myxococcales bacterium]